MKNTRKGRKEDGSRKGAKKRPLRAVLAAALLSGTAGCTIETPAPIVNNYPYVPDGGTEGCQIEGVEAVAECGKASADGIRDGEMIVVGEVGFRVGVVNVDQEGTIKAVSVTLVSEKDSACVDGELEQLFEGESAEMTLDGKKYTVSVKEFTFDAQGALVSLEVTPECYQEDSGSGGAGGSA